MDLKKLTTQAKAQAKVFGDKAQKELDRRGGTEGLKASAKNIADAAKTGGTTKEKAQRAAEAAKREAAK